MAYRHPDPGYRFGDIASTNLPNILFDAVMALTSKPADEGYEQSVPAIPTAQDPGGVEPNYDKDYIQSKDDGDIPDDIDKKPLLRSPFIPPIPNHNTGGLTPGNYEKTYARAKRDGDIPANKGLTPVLDAIGDPAPIEDINVNKTYRQSEDDGDIPDDVGKEPVTTKIGVSLNGIWTMDQARFGQGTQYNGYETPSDFSPSKILSLISKNGFARQNKYTIEIPTKTLLDASRKIYNAVAAGGASKNSEVSDLATDWMGEDYYEYDIGATAIELTAFCEKAQIPGYQFQLETVRHYGPSYKIPHMPEYQDVTFTFLCGDQMWERWFFDAWMYLVMDPVSNNFNYKSEYAVDIGITQFSESWDWDMTPDERKPGLVKTYWTRMVDAFPVSINEQPLGYDMNNTVQKIDVTFSYKYLNPWRSSTTGFQSRGDRQKFRGTISNKNPNK